nr:hypothetical protein [uncultured Desulfobacter sp.]
MTPKLEAELTDQIGGAMVTMIRIPVSAMTPWGSLISEIRISPSLAGIFVSFSPRNHPFLQEPGWTIPPPGRENAQETSHRHQD